MRKFEVGKRCKSGAVKFEIVSRTAKTVTYKLIQHTGRTNERAGEAKQKIKTETIQSISLQAFTK